MSRWLFVLIPPSEAKTTGGTSGSSVGLFDAELGAHRALVRDALGAVLDVGGVFALEKTLGVRAGLLDQAMAASRLIVEGVAPMSPAWQRYSGVVWNHLEPATLSSSQLRRILVPSGLYGVTTGEDPVAEYRLKMDVRLAPLGRLNDFWRLSVTSAIAAHVKGAVVVNLLPNEHRLAVDESLLEGRLELINVGFVSYAGDRAVGHNAKAVKGILARRLLCDGVGVLDDFHWRGWKSTRQRGEIVVRGPKK